MKDKYKDYTGADKNYNNYSYKKNDILQGYYLHMVSVMNGEVAESHLALRIMTPLSKFTGSFPVPVF